ncbi:IS481 family transposase [Rhodophyticola sp. CCM32]|uniref:IS481 family transposase n=1 Tax=Rhodophyticola sp. CCM32 TaxID=2916397 RepID=UPI00107FB7A1|nr:IS481 family transposase [Rhodophyticola sp. CCM32]QBY02703.1 IS481 family transposase [Rhodophyticola sp. CCM32]QBY02704.1 IS481 family transposase [Rhodophyticola sp. CCM32]
MNLHKNARLAPLGRERLVRLISGGMSFCEAGAACGCSAKTAAKWWRRFEREGHEGLLDRTSRPHCLRNPTPDNVAEQIVALRRQRLTGAHIAAKTGVSPATVSRVLRRAGLSRLRDLEPAEPVRRYEREHPGELIHLDIKRLGKFERTGHRITGDRTGQSNSRGIGWEYVHVCVDDASRLSFTDIHPDEKAVSAIAHLKAAVAWYATMGVTVARVMTDNGSCYKSHAFKAACAELGIRHIRTKPYTPKTNGKAERFIQSALREWAYARAYETSDDRAADLPVWTHLYNWHRPHSALKSKPPISRLGLDPNNLLRFHI